MRPKLKVDCYKKSGKWAYSNMVEDDYPEIPHELYPTLVDSFDKDPTRQELWEMQRKATFELGEMIRANDPKLKNLSPEQFGFDNGYIYVIEVLWPTCHYQGFCQFIMDKTQ